VLTSTRSEHVSRLRRLHDRKGRKRSGTFLAEGPDCVHAAVEAGWVLEVVGLEGHPMAAWIQEQGLPFHSASEHVVASICDAVTPQGVVAECRLPQTRFDDVAAGTGPVIVCDRISDPGNFGTIVRTAEAVGAAGVVATEGSVDPWNAKVVRASAGSVFRVPVVGGFSSPVVMTRIAETRRTIALNGSADLDVFEMLTHLSEQRIPSDQLAWVVGSEAHGVSDEVLAGAEFSTRIPMAPLVESLNAGIAVAVCLYSAQDRLGTSAT
jgi:TrmH family RNA methyltransferase